MPHPLEAIIENLRKASVQHGAAIVEMRADIKAIGGDLHAGLERLGIVDEALAQVVKDLQALAGAGPVTGDDEAPRMYAGEGGEEEEDAEFEEAGG